jgi:hypothetical protein
VGDNPMTMSPHAEAARYVGEATVATSSPQGTALPRAGVFWGVHAPQYHSVIVLGEDTSPWANETQIRGWLEPHEHLTEQTSLARFQRGRLKIANFLIDLNAIYAGIYGDPTATQFATGSYPQATTPYFVRDDDVARAIVPRWDDLTESPWRRLRDALAPLRSAASLVLEAISIELEENEANSDQSRHAGLAAVAWLTKLLGLTRPTILRMGGVPESTFYAWQKNPQSTVRTPSVRRLLRLQAHVGLLAEALGLNGLRTWLLSGDHVEGLQGDDATFEHTLTEAEEALTETTRITPRPRVRLKDYEFDTEKSTDNPPLEFPGWPGASKLPEEPTE